MEDQPAAWGGGVQRLVQGPEPGAVAAQPGHDGDQVLQGPGQPVQARHHQGVACEEVVQARRELRPVGGLARQLVGEHPKTADLGQGADLPVQVSARKSTPGRTRSARRSGSPAQARAVVIGAGEAGRGRRHPLTVRETAVPEFLDTSASQHVFRALVTCRRSGSRAVRAGV